jgi:hypothetical protein
MGKIVLKNFDAENVAVLRCHLPDKLNIAILNVIEN